MSFPISQMDVFGTEQFIDTGDFIRLAVRLVFNLGFASTVILAIYYRVYRNRDFVFTYYLFNLITFAMCVLLRKVPMELGFALGLFAVFGILRYRTEQIPIRDLTYMFVLIGMGILNGVANKKVSTAELLLVNVAIIAITAGLELPAAGRRHGTLPMLYDNLSLLRPEQHDLLLADLGERTGLEVVRVQVHRVDFLRDAAEITVFYKGARPMAAAGEESKRDAA